MIDICFSTSIWLSDWQDSFNFKILKYFFNSTKKKEALFRTISLIIWSIVRPSRIIRWKNNTLMWSFQCITIFLRILLKCEGCLHTKIIQCIIFLWLKEARAQNLPRYRFFLDLPRRKVIYFCQKRQKREINDIAFDRTYWNNQFMFSVLVFSYWC